MALKLKISIRYKNGLSYVTGTASSYIRIMEGGQKAQPHSRADHGDTAPVRVSG